MGRHAARGDDAAPGGQHGRARLAEHADFIEFVSKEFPDVFARWEERRADRGL